MDFHHIPVMADAVIDGLNIKPDGVYVDCTLGGAGHSSMILKKLGSSGKLIGIDRDEDAIRASENRLNPQKIIRMNEGISHIEDISEGDERISLIKSNYRDIKKILTFLNIEKVDGILLDLGVSSHQFDKKERGFRWCAKIYN